LLCSTGKWVYPFLDWSQGPPTAIWYFVVAIIVVVAFFIMILVHWIRDLIARKTGKAEVQQQQQQQQQQEIHQDHSVAKLETRQSTSQA
jgi:flagellar biosynthesis/type III secretory pathway M-ring protein FliF/YscJ